MGTGAAVEVVISGGGFGGQCAAGCGDCCAAAVYGYGDAASREVGNAPAVDQIKGSYMDTSLRSSKLNEK